MLHNLRHACWKQSMSNMHVAKQSMSTSFGHACCIIEDMHVANKACSTCMSQTNHVDIIPPQLKMGTDLLASLGSKGKNGNSLACLRNAGSHSAVTYWKIMMMFIWGGGAVVYSAGVESFFFLS